MNGSSTALSDRVTARIIGALFIVGTAAWLTRVAMQLAWPQGSVSPVLQFGMLAAFVAVFVCHAVSLWAVVAQGRAG